MALHENYDTAANSGSWDGALGMDGPFEPAVCHRRCINNTIYSEACCIPCPTLPTSSVQMETWVTFQLCCYPDEWHVF